MMESCVTILDRLTPIALTALLQTTLMLGSAYVVARLVRKRHALCHAICLGTLIGCLICPMLAYGLFYVDATSPWLVQIADTDETDVAQAPADIVEQQVDVANSASESTFSHTTPALMADSAQIEDAAIEERPSAIATSQHAPEESSAPSVSDQRPAETTPFEPIHEDAATKASDSPGSKMTDSRAWANVPLLRSAARWFVGVWCLLVAFLSSRMLLRSLRLKRLLANTLVVDNADVQQIVNSMAERTCLRRVPKVIASRTISTPFVYGMRVPQIVIPEFLTDPSCTNQLRDVLAHEMCHLSRGDLWKSFAQRLVQLVYCINPLVHLLAATMAQVREEICDNHALRFTTPADYCRTLLSMAERAAKGDQSSRPLHVLPLSGHARRWSLETRVADLLLSSRRRETRLHRKSAIVFAIIFCTVVAATCRVMVVNDAFADELTVTSSRATDDPPNVESATEAEDLLKQVLEKAKWWTGSRKETLKSLAYDYERAGRQQSVELVNGVSAARRAQWEGTTITSGLHWLRTKSSDFDITLNTLDNDSTAIKANDVIRFVCKRRESAKPMSVAFGNGIEGSWSGYFSQGFQEVVIEVDRSTMLPLRERVGHTTVTYDEWKQADASHWVPGLISIRRLDTQWDMHFDWLEDKVWLLTETETKIGNQKSVIARTLNVRVNDKNVERKLTERAQIRQQSTAALRKLYEHNRLWLQQELTSCESISYTFHTQREDIKESCYVNKDGYAVFEVTHDGKNKHEGTGQRKIALPNGHWATGDRTQEYLYPHEPNKDSRWGAYGHEVRKYAAMGCQLDLPLFRLQKMLNNVQATTKPGQWDGKDCDVSLIGGVGRSAWLGSGTMLAFSSWSYVHHIYPVSTTLYIDKTRHVPLHESIQGGRNHNFEIDYLDWKEVEPDQWVPMAIKVESKGYFTCELKFQLVKKRHWMLKEVTSWFDASSKSRGVISNVQVDKPSELWAQSKAQLETTQTLFSPKEAGEQDDGDSQITIETTPLTFGKWVTVDRVKAMLTLPSTFAMHLKIQTAEEPTKEHLPVVLFDKSGRVVSSGTVHLQKVSDTWSGTMMVSVMNAEDIASVAISGQRGLKKSTVNVVARDIGKTQAVNVPDNAAGKTRVAEIEFSNNEDNNATVRLKIVSTNGPQQFPVTANVALFDEQNQLVACGEHTESILVKGKPHVGDFAINVGVVSQLPRGGAVAVTVRNGRATSAPMGSGWGRFVGFQEVTVPMEVLFAADDPKCHEIAVQRLNAKLADDTIKKEFFSDQRDRTRAIERKQLRSDLLKPVAVDLARIAQSDASDELRRAAVRLLGHSGDTGQTDALLPLLDSADEITRDVTAIALAMLGNDAGFSRLERILQTASAALGEITLTGQGTDPEWRKKKDAWLSLQQTEQDVLIALVSLGSDAASNLLGRTLMEDLGSLSVGADEKGKSRLDGRAARASKIISIAKHANEKIVPWLTSAVEFFGKHPDIRALTEKWFRTDDALLADALLAHEEDAKEVIAQQIRRRNMPFVYAIKESRNPWYIPAVREMLLTPSVESWMYQKGIDYLWSVGTPEAVSLLQKLYDHEGPDDYNARMRLCRALVHFKDARGIPDALSLVADSFASTDGPADGNVVKANAKLNEKKRRQADYVLRQASDEMLLSAVLNQIETTDTATRRAILHALRAVNSLPAAVKISVQTWSESDGHVLQKEVRDFMAVHGIEPSP